VQQEMENQHHRYTHRIYREQIEIKTAAVRTLQRFFYRKIAMRHWRVRARRMNAVLKKRVAVPPTMELQSPSPEEVSPFPST